MKFKEAVECLAKADLRDELDLLLSYRSAEGNRKGWDTWLVPQLSDAAVCLLSENRSALAMGVSHG